MARTFGAMVSLLGFDHASPTSSGGRIALENRNKKVHESQMPASTSATVIGSDAAGLAFPSFLFSMVSVYVPIELGVNEGKLPCDLCRMQRKDVGRILSVNWKAKNRRRRLSGAPHDFLRNGQINRKSE